MDDKKKVIREGTTLRIDHPIVQKKIKDSLKLSVKEGSYASISTGFGTSYLSPFALALNATTFQMGILHAIISLVPNFVQLRAATLIKKFSRKKIVLGGVLLRVLMWIPILLTGLMFYVGIRGAAWTLIGLIGLLYTLNAIIHPAWFSWMGSLVPENGRGDYFSRRNMYAGFFGVITMIVAAAMLDGIKKFGISYGNEMLFTLLGFGLLFLLAMSSGAHSLGLLKKQYEPKLHLKKRDYFTFKQFLKRAKETPFGQFSIFRMAFSFAVGIASPFWAVYMIRNLDFSYVWYMMITVSSTLFRLAFLPMLGKFSDTFGNIKLMRICTWFASFIPFLWLLSTLIDNSLALKLYLLFVPSIIAGIAWAGYDLAVNNYVYDAVSSAKRSFGVSYMNLLVGIGTFLGAGLGSLITLFNISFMNNILFIFLVSAIFRILVSIFGPRMLHEVRHVKKFSYEFLIREFLPMQGMIREIHNLEHLVQKNEHYA